MKPFILFHSFSRFTAIHTLLARRLLAAITFTVTAGLFMLSSCGLKAQTHEIGLFTGVSYYLGDMNPERHFQRSSPALGLHYRTNRSEFIALRVNAAFSELQGFPDLMPHIANLPPSVAGDTLYQFTRNGFRSGLWELSGQLEMNFLPFYPDDRMTNHTPFLFLGAGAMSYETRSAAAGPAQQNPPDAINLGRSITGQLMFGLGYKINISRRINAGLEWGMRYSFTNLLDGLDDPRIGANPYNDWYSFAGFFISYSFADPCRSICPD